MNLRCCTCLRAETAIRAGDNVLAPDDTGKAFDALGDKFSVFDQHR